MDEYYWKATVEGQTAPVYVKAVDGVHARALIENMGHTIVSVEKRLPVKAERKPRERQGMFDGQFREESRR